MYTMMKRNMLNKIFSFCNTSFLLLLSVVMIYPLWYVLCASLSESNLFMAHSSILLKPIGFSLASYKMMLKNSMIVRSTLNSIFILVSGTTINVIMTLICAYVVSRKNVYWNSFFSKMIVFTMFFNGGLIPNYLFITKVLHMNNSYWALLLPGAINVYNMIIMRTAFYAIPDSIEESAKIDGAKHLRILFSIMLPLVKSTIAVMVLYYGVAHWNSWFDASIYIKSREKYPLQLILREILINNDTTLMANGIGDEDQQAVAETIKYATVIFATIPILCVYPFLQKYFVKGVMIGAVKG